MVSGKTIWMGVGISDVLAGLAGVCRLPESANSQRHLLRATLGSGGCVLGCDVPAFLGLFCGLLEKRRAPVVALGRVGCAEWNLGPKQNGVSD